MQLSKLFLVFPPLLKGKDKYSFSLEIGRRERTENKTFFPFPGNFEGFKIHLIPQWNENEPCSYLHRGKNLRKGKNSQRRVDKDIHLVLL